MTLLQLLLLVAVQLVACSSNETLVTTDIKTSDRKVAAVDGAAGLAVAGSGCPRPSAVLRNQPLTALLAEIQRRRARSKTWMAPVDQAMLESYLQPTDVMLEWGSGRSTGWYSQFVGRYHSVEHNRRWFRMVENIVSGLPNVQLHLRAVVPGYLGWQGKYDEGTYEQFQPYVDIVKELNEPKFDRVLIDGRARVHCALAVLPFIDVNSTVFIHDYTWRPRYWGVEKHYERVALGASLVVLRKRAVPLADPLPYETAAVFAAIKKHAQDTNSTLGMRW